MDYKHTHTHTHTYIYIFIYIYRYYHTRIDGYHANNLSSAGSCSILQMSDHTSLTSLPITIYQSVCAYEKSSLLPSTGRIFICFAVMCAPLFSHLFLASQWMFQTPGGNTRRVVFHLTICRRKCHDKALLLIKGYGLQRNSLQSLTHMTHYGCTTYKASQPEPFVGVSQLDGRY